MQLTVMIVLLLFFSLMGMEIAWAIGIAAMAYIALDNLAGGRVPFVLFSQMMVTGIDGYSMLAIPLFIFAGDIMNSVGMTQRIIRLATALVGHFHGGLANVGVFANYVMSGISGSAIADAAATGTVLLPEMKRKGFPEAFSGAVIAAAATVGPIIPPSIIFVMLGALMEISVGRLFLAGIIPGTIMFVAMFAITWWISRKRHYPRETKATRVELMTAFRQGSAALLAPVVIIATIVLGIATPTEAAAVVVVYAAALGAFVYRTLTLDAVIRAAGRTAIASSVIMLTVSTSGVFAFIAVSERLGEILTQAMLSVSSNLNVLLFLANALLLVLGMFMEILPILLILAPILFPLFGGMGVDAVHLGVIIVLNLMIGMITPPIGLNLFVISAISGVGVIEIFRAAIPYVLVLFVVLMLITYVPELTMYLPNLLMPAT